MDALVGLLDLLGCILLFGIFPTSWVYFGVWAWCRGRQRPIPAFFRSIRIYLGLIALVGCLATGSLFALLSSGDYR